MRRRSPSIGVRHREHVVEGCSGAGNVCHGNVPPALTSCTTMKTRPRNLPTAPNHAARACSTDERHRHEDEEEQARPPGARSGCRRPARRRDEHRAGRRRAAPAPASHRGRCAAGAGPSRGPASTGGGEAGTGRRRRSTAPAEEERREPGTVGARRGEGVGRDPDGVADRLGHRQGEQRHDDLHGVRSLSAFCDQAAARPGASRVGPRDRPLCCPGPAARPGPAAALLRPPGRRRRRPLLRGWT